MSTFINIAADEEKQILVDAENVTAIIFSPDTGDLSIVDKKNEPLHIKGHAHDVMKKLAGQGFPMETMAVLSDGDLLYVAPSAVTFIKMPLPEKNGMVYAVVGINGVGALRVGKMAEEWQTMIDIIEKEGKKSFLKFEPENAGPSDLCPEKVYVDAKTVKAIQADGIGARLIFENCGSIDLDSRHQKDMRLLEMFTDAARDKFILQNYDADRRCAKQLGKFIQEVVKVGGTLKAVPQEAALRQTYLRSEDITEVRSDDITEDGSYSLGVRVRQERMDGAAFSFFWFTYANKEDCAQAAAQLTGPPPPKKPSTPSPE